MLKHLVQKNRVRIRVVCICGKLNENIIVLFYASLKKTQVGGKEKNKQSNQNAQYTQLEFRLV